MLTYRALQRIPEKVVWSGLNIVYVHRFQSDLEESNVDGKVTYGELDGITMTQIRVTATGSLQSRFIRNTLVHRSLDFDQKKKIQSIQKYFISSFYFIMYLRKLHWLHHRVPLTSCCQCPPVQWESQYKYLKVKNLVKLYFLRKLLSGTD